MKRQTIFFSLTLLIQFISLSSSCFGYGNTNTPSIHSGIRSLSGQVTVGIGGDYPSLTGSGGLFQTISANPVSGDITAIILSDLNEPGTFALYQWTEVPPGNYTLTIKPDGPTERLIVGTAAKSLIRFIGARNTIIDGGFNGNGKYLRFRNTNNSYGLFEFSNNAMFDTLRNCIWESGNTSSTNSSSGVIRFSTSTGLNGNNFNTIKNNIIRDRTDINSQPHTAIYSNGSQTAFNSFNIISDNEILNFTQYGLLISNYNGNGWTISGNSFYNTLPSAQNTTVSIIYLASGNNSSGNIISGNFIGGSGPGCSGSNWEISSGFTPFYGIYCSTGFSFPTDISLNEISNIHISSGGFYGIYCIGSGYYKIGSLGGNIIGSDSLTNSLIFSGGLGIYLNTSMNNSEIVNNTFGNISISSSFTGIHLYGADVKKNRIFKISSTQSSGLQSITGISNGGSTAYTHVISNNIIDLTGSLSAIPNIFGFRDISSNSASYEFYFNTIYIHGVSYNSYNTYGVYISGEALYIMKDNIIFNDYFSAGTGTHYSIYDISAGSLESDFNDLLSTNGPLGYNNGTTATDLTTWQNITSGDLNSLSEDPLFASTTDLHPTNTFLNNAGIAIPGITTDFEGVTRGNPPDIGALEFSVLPTVITLAASAVTDTGAILNGEVTANNSQTTVTFEWGTTPAFGNVINATPNTVIGSSPNSVSAILTGLTTNTTYYFRCAGTNLDGTVFGETLNFHPGCPQIPPASQMSGPASVCAYNGNYVYSIEPLANAEGYLWDLPNGAIITSGDSTNCITVMFGDSSGNISVVGISDCDTSDMGIINVTVNPIPSPTVSGPGNICVNSGYYTYSTEAGFEDYTWTISTGGTIIYGAGTNSITVTWDMPGLQNISVNYFNSYGCSAPTAASLSIMVNPLPGNADSITGVSSVCAGETGVEYHIDSVQNATAYAWYLPSGINIVSGLYSNNITVNFDSTASSGDIFVMGNNICGNGAPSPLFPVNVNPIPSTPTISAIGSTLFSNAISGNQWYLNGTLIPGAIEQVYEATETGEYFVIVTLDGCSSAPSNTILFVITFVETQLSENIQISPVPNNGSFKLLFSWLNNGPVVIEVYNNSGIVVYQSTVQSVSGINKEYIDLDTAASGVYYVVVKDKKHQLIRRFILKK